MRIKHLFFTVFAVFAAAGAPLAVHASPAEKQVNATQGYEVTGHVTDAQTREPVAGAFVVEKGTTNGVMTNEDGSYTIDVADIRTSQLEISFMGYKTVTVDIGTRGIVDVALESDNELDAVVVVGGGTQKKISVVGAVTSISGEALRTSSSSLTNALAGKLAGVISMTGSGEPGTTSSFYIRGVSTFGGRAEPLILLDDVEISAGDLNRIPAENIASFTILKDASATAIYGVRGANGVMLVTTKKGIENQRALVNVTVENSYVRPYNMVEFVDGATWMSAYNEAMTGRNPGSVQTYSDQTIERTFSHQYPYTYPDVDWQKLLFRKWNMNQRAHISIQGGGNKVTYFMSLQMNHNTGMLNGNPDGPHMFNTNIQQMGYTFQNNISYKVTNTTTLDLHLNAQINQNKGPRESTQDIFGSVYTANPVDFPAFFPAQEGDNHIRFGNKLMQSGTRKTNPYAGLLDDYAETNSNTLNASLKLDQRFDFITEGLGLTALVNWKNWSSSTYYKSQTPYFYQVDDATWDASTPDVYDLEYVGDLGQDFVTTSGPDKSQDQTFYFDARLTYDRTFGKHAVSGLLMYMMREYRLSVLPERNQGLSGRATYGYDDRYFVEFNFGYNGTERFEKGRRFEFFPAVSAGWVPSNESFWGSASNAISYLKIRGSYGHIGSDGFGGEHFVYYDTIILGGSASYTSGPSYNGNYPIITSQGVGIGGYAVENPRWERSRKMDIGVDATLFKQLDITFDYFFEWRDRIMMQRGSWPQIMGYSNATPWANVGKENNWGYEFSFNWSRNFGKDWYLNLRGNFTYTQNKYVYKDEPNYPFTWQKDQNMPLDGYKYRGYIAEGLFTSQEEIDNWPTQALGGTPMVGDIKYRDITGDGIINEDDQTIISPYGGTPRIQYGFGLSVRYKNWDLGAFFNGSALRKIMINGITPFGTNDNNLMAWIYESRWSEDNPDPNAKYPRLGVTDAQNANNNVNSTYWLRDAGFLRFKTLELGYSFKFGRVYLNCDNLAVWSPFKLWDPELGWNSYPFSRTFSLGVQFNF